MIVVALAVVAAIAYAFVPRPVEVDLALVERGPLEVTVDEDGQTRLRERYVVSSPLMGRMRRLEWDAGDAVEADELLAVIDPIEAELLDPRTRATAEAQVRAAQASQSQAEATLAQAEARLELAADELERIEQMFERGAANRRELDDAVLTERIRRREVEAAEFAVEVAEHEVELAEAALLRTQPTDKGQPAELLEIRAPVAGQVLRVMQESEAVVTAGQALLEVGDPNLLEIVVDVLSTDAVRITPGDPVHIAHWGGDELLRGVVRRVEPQAFTKISALGVEEQRVNIIIDFVSPAERWRQLGDGYRVEARIVIWREMEVLKAPTSALFRRGEDWAVFVVRDGRAQVQPVVIGQTTGLETQIIDGLSAGDVVVSHPSDRMNDDTAIEPRADR